jgi:hypothetical protein
MRTICQLKKARNFRAFDHNNLPNSKAPMKKASICILIILSGFLSSAPAQNDVVVTFYNLVGLLTDTMFIELPGEIDSICGIEYTYYVVMKKGNVSDTTFHLGQKELSGRSTQNDPHFDVRPYEFNKIGLTAKEGKRTTFASDAHATTKLKNTGKKNPAKNFWIISELKIRLIPSSDWFVPKYPNLPYPQLTIENLVLGKEETSFPVFKSINGKKKMSNAFGITSIQIEGALDSLNAIKAQTPQNTGVCGSLVIAIDGNKPSDNFAGRIEVPVDAKKGNKLRINLENTAPWEEQLLCIPSPKLIIDFIVPDKRPDVGRVICSRQDTLGDNFEMVNVPPLVHDILTQPKPAIKSHPSSVITSFSLSEQVITPCTCGKTGGSVNFAFEPKVITITETKLCAIIKSQEKEPNYFLDTISYSYKKTVTLDVQAKLKIDTSESLLPIVNNTIQKSGLLAGSYSIIFYSDAIYEYPFVVPEGPPCGAKERLVIDPYIYSACLSKMKRTESESPCQQDFLEIMPDSINLKEDEVIYVIISLDRTQLENLDINALFNVNPSDGRFFETKQSPRKLGGADLDIYKHSEVAGKSSNKPEEKIINQMYLWRIEIKKEKSPKLVVRLKEIETINGKVDVYYKKFTIKENQ